MAGYWAYPGGLSMTPPTAMDSIMANYQPANTYPFQGFNPQVKHRPILDAIMAGGQFLGNLGNFAGGAAQLGNFVTGGQGLSGNILRQFTRGGGGGGGMLGGEGGGGGATGAGAPFGTQAMSHGPLTNAIIKHSPQAVLMNTQGPVYQQARDLYLGPARPGFAATH